jgi:hypothetical protein
MVQATAAVRNTGWLSEDIPEAYHEGGFGRDLHRRSELVADAFGTLVKCRDRAQARPGNNKRESR